MRCTSIKLVSMLLLLSIQHGASGRPRLFQGGRLPRGGGVIRKQCDAYALGFLTILQTVELLKLRGGLTRQNITDAVLGCTTGCAHMVVHKQQLYVGKVRKGFQSRLEATIQMLAQSVPLLHGNVPDVEFVVSVNDGPSAKAGTWNNIRDKTSRDAFVMPAFPQYMWMEADAPPWSHTLAYLNATEGNRTWADKPAKAYFSGASAAIRRDFLSQIPPGDDLAISLSDQPGFVRAPPEAACSSRFTLLWDGVTASLRASTLALCKSVIIHHNSTWEDWVIGVLNAHSGWGGMQSVGSNWTSLRTIMSEANANPSKVDAEVADRATLMQRLLSPVGINCYWQQLMHEMAGLLRYPVALEPAEAGETLVPVEEWLLTSRPNTTCVFVEQQQHHL